MTQKDEADTVFTLLEKCEEMERINETYYFKFSMNDETMQEITNNSAIYMSIKKAFTPYAVLHMLR